MKAAVVVNPIRVGDAAQLRAQLERALPAAELSWYETTPEDPGGGQARQALTDGAELVIVCGGDGTVTACAGELADSGVPLALLPAGTGNLLARNLRLPLERNDALAVATGTGRRRIDVVRTTLGPSTVIAGLGVDAAMIRDTDERWKERVGWAAYLSGIARALRRPPRARYRIEVDGEPPAVVHAVAVLVGNVGELQGGMAVLPQARPDDGRLHVLAFMPRGAVEISALLWRLVRRTAPASPRTLSLTGQRVTIVADRPVPAQLDGEYVGAHDSLAADVRTGALTVCVP